MSPTTRSSTRPSTATPATASRACGYLRTNVLSARPDLKKYTALRFQQDVKRHPDAAGPGQDVVLVFMEALDLNPPLTLVSSDLQLELEGYPVEQGAVIEIPLLPPGSRGPAKGFG
ncbi:MAG: hypothetical protein ACKO8I_00035 [Cyanobacteriota bacterium]